MGSDISDISDVPDVSDVSEEQMAEQPASERQAPDAAGRRPYTSPRLIEYGSVAKLTRGSRSIQSDAPKAGFARKP